jgi:hypothetical protein
MKTEFENEHKYRMFIVPGVQSTDFSRAVPFLTRNPNQGRQVPISPQSPTRVGTLNARCVEQVGSRERRVYSCAIVNRSIRDANSSLEAS